MLIKPFHDPYAVRHDGTTDLTGDWTISTNSITLTAGTLTASTLHATSRIDVGADDAIAHLYIHDAGTIVMYDDSDDTSVTIGPVANGTSTMGLTGSLHVSDSIGIGRSPTLDFDVYDDEVDFGLESTKTTSGGGYTRMRFNAAGKAGQAANTRNFAVNNANADSTHNENKLTYQARNDDNTHKHDLFAIHHGGVVEFGKIDRAANMPMKLLTAAGYDSSILFAEFNETIGAKLVYDGGDDKFYLKTYNNPTEYIPIAVTRTGVIDFALGFKIVADSQKIILGADDDAEIYYDGSKLIIDDTINQTISLADNNLTTTGGVTAGASTFGDGGTTNYAAISATGDLVFYGSGGLSFAEIYTTDASDTITIAVTGKANKVQITSFTADGVSNNMTPDHTNDHITVVKAGMYLCNVSIHAVSTGGGGADNFGYSVYKNNGATEFPNLHGQRDLTGGGGDEGSMTLSGIIDLAVNDTIEVWIWNNTNADDVVIDDINLSLVQVGGT